MEHRGPRILPALVAQAALAPGRVLDEAVAVAIAELVDPAQRRLDVRPERADGVEIAGALVVQPGQHDEQRRGVDAAVVESEGHFAEPRHLAPPGLVQDLPGLSVGLGPLLLGLRRREKPQHAPGERRVDPQHCMAVMMPSRPNAVQNQGIPAYG